MHKLWKYIKGLLKVVVILALLFLGLVVVSAIDIYNRLNEGEKISTVRKSDGTKVVGKEKEDALKGYNLVKTFDKALQDTAVREMTDAEREAEFQKTWNDIKSHMVDPAPGTYPVKFFGLDDGAFPLFDMDSYTSFPAEWLGERHVMYWGRDFGGSYRTNDLARLIILDTETKKVQEIDKHKRGNNVCFDPETKNISYLIYEGRAAKHGGIWSVIYGHLDEGMRFIKESEGDIAPREFYLDKHCRYQVGNVSDRGGQLKPGDGWMRAKKGGISMSGYYTWTHQDGSETELKINGYPSYDSSRDQYFVAKSFSMEDQRSYVRYYTRDFDLVEEVIFPRVLLQETFPDSFLYMPAKDGFVLKCGSRADASREKDSAGDPFRQYLCHVKRDQTIVRALTGAVHNMSVSPSGCRVFGFWKEYSNDDRRTGKNFVVDLCKQELSGKGE